MKLQARVNQRLLAEVPRELPVAAPEGPWPAEVLLFTQLPLAEALELQELAREAITEGAAPGHRLILTEHAPVYAFGPDSAAWSGPDAAACASLGAEQLELEDEPGIAFYGPGQLAAHLTLSLSHLADPALAGPEQLTQALVKLILAVLRDFNLSGEPQPGGHSILTNGATLATLHTQLRGDVAMARIILHTNTDPDFLTPIRDSSGATPAIVSLAQLGVPIERQDDARGSLMKHFERIFGTRLLIPQRQEGRATKPPWLKARLPHSAGTARVHEIIGEQRLHTVCESAHCPNMGECWKGGTATFMINGNVCTRSCSFCAVFTGKPLPLDPDEPRRVAEAAQTMGLRYVVVTSVNRDEREDGGAYQFVNTIAELRRAIPDVRIEVLIPDFKGNAAAQDAVFAARPEVLNHNMETVRALYHRVRPQAQYQRSLDLIRRAKFAGLVAKSGIMLGLGEEDEQVAELLTDLYRHGCDIVTIGQYLRPSEKHHPVVRYVPPSEFDRWRDFGLALGLKTVESGPLVRSSYHANESFDKLRGW